MSGPADWIGAPRHRGTPIFRRDSYGVTYLPDERGTRRTSERISKLSRAERKAIWSKAVAVN